MGTERERKPCIWRFEIDLIIHEYRKMLTCFRVSGLVSTELYRGPREADDGSQQWVHWEQTCSWLAEKVEQTVEETKKQREDKSSDAFKVSILLLPTTPSPLIHKLPVICLSNYPRRFRRPEQSWWHREGGRGSALEMSAALRHMSRRALRRRPATGLLKYYLLFSSSLVSPAVLVTEMSKCSGS